MNKICYLLVLKLTLLILVLGGPKVQEGGQPQIDENDVKEAIDEDQIVILQAIQEDPDMLNLIKEEKLDLNANTLGIAAKKCTGMCYEVAMDFPPMNQFKGTFLNWQVSHGTPSVSANSVWMWSASNIGEGINLAASFQKGKDYCIESTLTLSRMTSGTNPPPAPSASNANIDLTVGPILGSTANLGTPIPNLAGPSQQILQQGYTGLVNPYNQNYILSFTASDNFSNIWFHPYSPTVQVNMQILKVKICEENDPCAFDVRVRQRIFCGFAKFYALVYSATGLNVLGYTWDFGDGTTSNDPFPSHFYNNSGSYIVTLRVSVRNSNGECCTKIYTFRVDIRECDPCKTLNFANILMTNFGSSVKFEPTVPSSFGFLYYEWEFSDGTYYSTREVWKSWVPSTASLTIYYIADYSDRPCCSVTIKRRFYFNPLGNLVSAYPFKQISVSGSDDKCVEDAESKLKDVSREDDISLKQLEDVDLQEHHAQK